MCVRVRVCVCVVSRFNFETPLLLRSHFLWQHTKYPFFCMSLQRKCVCVCVCVCVRAVLGAGSMWLTLDASPLSSVLFCTQDNKQILPLLSILAGGNFRAIGGTPLWLTLGVFQLLHTCFSPPSPCVPGRGISLHHSQRGAPRVMSSGIHGVMHLDDLHR